MTGKKYAVVIGVNDYHESLGKLNYAEADAELVWKTLIERCGFQGPDILLLTDAGAGDNKPTYGNIHSWLSTWLERLEADDMILFYFAGHGRAQHGQTFLVPGDATMQTLDETGIPLKRLYDQLEKCKAGSKIVILDACRSGAGRDILAMPVESLEQCAETQGVYTIASCEPDQISHEDQERGHGIFTWALTSAIAETDGVISLNSVYEKCCETVREWCAPKRLTQRPKKITENDFDIILADSDVARIKIKNKALKSLTNNNSLPSRETEANCSDGQVSWRNIPLGFRWTSAVLFPPLMILAVGIVVAVLFKSVLYFVLTAVLIVFIPFTVLIIYLRQNRKKRYAFHLNQAREALIEQDYELGLNALQGLDRPKKTDVAELKKAGYLLGQAALKAGNRAVALKIFHIAGFQLGSYEARIEYNELTKEV